MFLVGSTSLGLLCYSIGLAASLIGIFCLRKRQILYQVVAQCMSSYYYLFDSQV